MFKINNLIEALKPYYDFKFNDNSRKFNESEKPYTIRENEDVGEKYTIIRNPDSDSILLYKIEKHNVFYEDLLNVQFDSKDSLEIEVDENSPEHKQLIFLINAYNRRCIKRYKLLVNFENVSKSDRIKITISCPINDYTVTASRIKDFICQAEGGESYYNYYGYPKEFKAVDKKYFDTKFADEHRTEREESLSLFLLFLTGFLTGIKYPNPLKYPIY